MSLPEVYPLFPIMVPPRKKFGIHVEQPALSCEEGVWDVLCIGRVWVMFFLMIAMVHVPLPLSLSTCVWVYVCVDGRRWQLSYFPFSYAMMEPKSLLRGSLVSPNLTHLTSHTCISHAISHVHLTHLTSTPSSLPLRFHIPYITYISHPFPSSPPHIYTYAYLFSLSTIGTALCAMALRISPTLPA